MGTIVLLECCTFSYSWILFFCTERSEVIIREIKIKGELHLFYIIWSHSVFEGGGSTTAYLKKMNKAFCGSRGSCVKSDKLTRVCGIRK